MTLSFLPVHGAHPLPSLASSARSDWPAPPGGSAGSQSETASQARPLCAWKAEAPERRQPNPARRGTVERQLGLGDNPLSLMACRPEGRESHVRLPLFIFFLSFPLAPRLRLHRVVSIKHSACELLACRRACRGRFRTAAHSASPQSLVSRG